MQLVTVRFTTKHLVSVFDAAGKKVREYEDAIPQCVSGIPRLTAETYRKFDNWTIEPYHTEPDRKASYKATGFKKGEIVVRTAAKSKGKSVLHEAAATGDLAAAINAGR